jgi:hypothetical protein
MPDEQEVQRWVRQFREDQRRMQETNEAITAMAEQFNQGPMTAVDGGALSIIGHSVADATAVTTVLDSAAMTAVDGGLPSFVFNQIAEALESLWNSSDPTGAKREAWRRIYGREPGSPFEMEMWTSPLHDSPAMSIVTDSSPGPEANAPTAAGAKAEIVETLPATQQLESRETGRANRKAARDDYKAECKATGVKVTDEMIGREVKPGSKDRRTIVQHWIRCDPRYENYDRRIRRVFADKPHLPRTA